MYVIYNLLYCFEYQLYETLGLNGGILAYEVAVPTLAQVTELLNAEKLVDHTSCYPVSFKISLYVVTKYNLDDVIALKSGNL